MIIEIEKEEVKISFYDGEINSAEKGQLQYYGFKRSIDDKNIYIYKDIDFINVAKEAYKYLVQHKITVEVSSILKNAIDDEIKEYKKFEELKQKAEAFKNGGFNDESFKKFCSFTRTLPRKLKPHQIKASYHHFLLSNSADFSVPGSGKTATLLTVYEAMKRNNIVNCIFVVGPLSSFTAWKTEFELTLGRKPVIQIFAGRPKKDRIGDYYDFSNSVELFLTTYQSFANDYQHISKFFSHPSNKAFFVVDEAHYIKQVDGKWAYAVLSAGEKAVSRHVLTGTPCPRNYSDLFNIFDLLWGVNTAVSDKEKEEITAYEKNEDYKNAGLKIKKNIDPLFYRVRKSDLGLIKPKFHEPIKIEMNEIEGKLYESVLKKITELSQFDNTENILTLLALKRGRITRLRQLTSYAKLLSTAIGEYSETIIDNSDLKSLIINYDKIEIPAKINVLINLIEEIRKKDRKILIWSNFIKSINKIESHLQKNGFNCSHIYGSVPMIGLPKKDVKSREKRIDEFLSFENKNDILIVNPGACAESISLHKSCYHAIYYDLSYNCAQYLQSLDRIHRIGGSERRVANYYFLQYENTIDEDILNNLIEKRDKMYKVIEYDSDIYNLDIDVYIDEKEDENAYDRLFSKR